MAGVQDGGEEVARKLPHVDVMLVVSSVRAERGRNVWTMVKPSGGGGQDCRRGVLGGVSARGWRRTGQGASVGCGGDREAPGCGVGRRSCLTVASREWGGGLAAVLSGEEAEEAKCGHARR
jgi:hypothetical protein